MVTVELEATGPSQPIRPVYVAVARDGEASKKTTAANGGSTKMKRIKLPAPVTDLYSAIEKLEKTYGCKIPLNGHLLGSIGEIVAQEVFGFELLPAHHARCKVRGNVQVKTTGMGGKFVALRRDCNHLLVLQVLNPEEAAILYDGPSAPAWEAAAMTRATGQRTISLSKLSELAVSQVIATADLSGSVGSGVPAKPRRTSTAG